MFACLSPSRDGVSVGGDLSPLWCLGMENPYAALKVDLEGSSLPGVQQGYPGSVSWHSPSARVVSNICYWRVELSMLWRWHILSASPFFSLLVLWFCWQCPRRWIALSLCLVSMIALTDFEPIGVRNLGCTHFIQFHVCILFCISI